MARISSFRETRERYPLLRVFATIFSGFGFLLLTCAAALFAVGIGSFLIDHFQMPDVIGRGRFFGAATIWSLGLFAAGLQAVAFGSLLKLAVHVEENTRAIAQALDQLRPAVDLKADVDPNSIFLS